MKLDFPANIAQGRGIGFLRKIGRRIERHTARSIGEQPQALRFHTQGEFVRKFIHLGLILNEGIIA